MQLEDPLLTKLHDILVKELIHYLNIKSKRCLVNLIISVSDPDPGSVKKKQMRIQGVKGKEYFFKVFFFFIFLMIQSN